jgi:hypothetical protein
MRRFTYVSAAVVAVALVAGAAATAGSAPDRDRDADLPQAGVYLEGIGVDKRAGAFYVSATNQSGAIFRGETHRGDQVLELWQPPTAGNDGRGIDVDHSGRVYVAGGPAAEVRVFSRAGELLAELPTAAAGSFLNDVWVGPDGAAYVTDSSLPVIWRVSFGAGGWQIERWLDVSPAISYTPPLTDFDLGGIVSTANGRFLLTTQGTTGQLWRMTWRRAGSPRSSSAARGCRTPTGSSCAGARYGSFRTSPGRSPSSSCATATGARPSRRCSRHPRIGPSRPPSASAAGCWWSTPSSASRPRRRLPKIASSRSRHSDHRTWHRRSPAGLGIRRLRRLVAQPTLGVRTTGREQV